MKIAHDLSGRVWLNGENLPDEWNGVSLTIVELNQEQEQAYEEAMGGIGVLFVNGQFSTIPHPPQTPLEAIAEIEQTNPITHRALREFFLAFGELYPASKASLLYQRVKSTDDAIKIERAKL